MQNHSNVEPSTDNTLEKIVEKMLLKIQKKMDDKPIIPIEHQLWDEHDIAHYFKYSLDYTKRHIIPNEYFPPSRELPTSATSDRTVSRWKAKDVINFGMAFDKANIKYN